MLQIIVDDHTNNIVDNPNYNKIVLDILPDEDILINKQLIDILDPNAPTTDYTFEFDLPNTKINQEYFESVFMLDINTLKFKRGKRIKSLITDGANTLIEGWLQLLQINVNNDDIKYQVVFNGMLKQIIEESQNILLSDLDFSEYNHIRNLETVVDSIDNIILKNNIKITSNEGYTYPEIIYQNNVNPSTKLLRQYFPAVYSHTILDKVINHLGWKLKSNYLNSEDFRNKVEPFTGTELTLNEEELQERTTIRGVTNSQVPITPYRFYYQTSGPYHNVTNNLKLSVGNQPGAFTDTTSSVTNFGNDIDFTDDLNQIGTPWPDQYVCQNPGMYNININFRMLYEYTLDAQAMGLSDLDGINSSPFDGNLKYRWQVVLHRGGQQQFEVLAENIGSTNPQSNYTYFQPDFGFIPKAQLPFTDTTDYITVLCNTTKELNPGDRIGIRIFSRIDWQGSIVLSGGASTYPIQTRLVLPRVNNGLHSIFEVSPIASGFGNESIDLANIVNKITIKDWLIDLINRHNLIVLPQNNGELLIESYDEYFNVNEPLDWTNKYDRNSDLSIKFDFEYKRYKFKYQEDSDWLNEDYIDQDSQNKTYGEHLVISQDEWTQNEYVFQSLYAPSINTRLDNADRVAPVLAKREDGDYIPMQCKPRILYTQYNPRECNQYTIKVSNLPGGQSTSLTKYKYVGMWDDPYAPNNTLEFGNSSKQYYGSNTKPFGTLYNRFYQRFIRNKINNDYRIVEGYFYLTPNDIAEFDFRIPIKIDNQVYRVLKIENYKYSTEESLTKVILEKLTDTTLFQSNRTGEGNNVSSCPTDVRSVRTLNGWVLMSDSGATITQDCCNERGGQWDPITQTCKISLVSDSGVGGGIGTSPTIPNTTVGGILNPSTPVNLRRIDYTIIDGGKNTTIDVSSTNNDYIIDGGLNAVRNITNIRGNVITDGDEFGYFEELGDN